MKQARDHCLAPARVGDALLAGGRYMRLFPELTPLAIEPKMLRAIGAAGELSDTGPRGDRPRGPGLAGRDPLWHYILREAAVREDGEQLGPVGSQLVGEVLLGVIDADPSSQRSVDPDWQPSLPSRQPGRFTLTDLLVPA